MKKAQKKDYLKNLKKQQRSSFLLRRTALQKLPPHAKGEVMHLKRYDPAPATEARDYFAFRDLGVVPSYLTKAETRQMRRLFLMERCLRPMRNALCRVFKWPYKDDASQYRFLLLESVYMHKHQRCLNHVAWLYTTSYLFRVLKTSYYTKSLPQVIQAFLKGPCTHIASRKLTACQKRLLNEQHERG